MSEFVKPVRRSVKVSDGFVELLGKELFKDLAENEGICPICHGTGMVIRDNPYGLEGDPDKQAGLFPYKHQSIFPCPNCYNGVVKYCPDCGKQLRREYLKCDCEAEQAREHENEHKKYLERVEKAQKCDSNTLGSDFVCAYSDYFPYDDGYFANWEEFFEAWYGLIDECKRDGSKIPERPMYVWGTELVEMQFNANDIISSACEELHEDAINEISDLAIRSMQNYFEFWKNRYATRSYCYTYRYAIRIPWEKEDN